MNEETFTIQYTDSEKQKILRKYRSVAEFYRRALILGLVELDAEMNPPPQIEAKKEEKPEAKA